MISAALNTFYGNPEQSGTASENPAKPAPRRLTRNEQDTLLAAVLEWQAAGCHVHPARCNGSKNPVSIQGAGTDIEPDLIPLTWPNGKPRKEGGQPNPLAGTWGYGYQRIRDGLMPPLTVDEMAAWFRQGRSDGIGIFCGVGSGNLEMVEVEGRARGLLVKIRDAADRLGCRDVLDRLSHGCVSESPSEGLHFLLRVSGAPAEGSQKLAARPDPDEPDGVLVLAETRGQGGWFVAAPSGNRTHKSGKPYRLVRGGPATIPTFTAAERDLIYQCFRAIDEMPQQPVDDRPRRPARQRREGEPLTPAEDFNRRATWESILEPKGWTKYGQQKQRALEGGGTDPVQEWSRPGRDGSKSATTTGSTLCCWSSSSPLPVFKQPKQRGGRGENVLSKFAVYAYLHHPKADKTPDWAAASAALRDLGYGEDDDLGDITPVVVETMPSRDEPRTLPEWQEEVAALRAMSVERIGYHLDRSPTGSGKTYATIQMLKAVPTSLTALPTHANVVERVQEMKAAGVDAVAYPQLSPATCQNYAEASNAQAYGLIAGAAVCPGCPFNRIPNPRFPGKTADGKDEPKMIPGPCHSSDQYLGLMKIARAAGHRVCTHERLRLSPDKVTDNAAVLVVDEDPELVVAPQVTVAVEDLARVDNLAREVMERWDAGALDHHQEAFAKALRATFAAISAAAQEATGPCVVDVESPVYEEDPKTWQPMIYKWIRRMGVVDLTPDAQQRFQQAMQLLTRATTGGLRTMQLLVEQTSRHKKQPDGTVTETHPLHHFVRGAWLTPLGSKPVFLLDATGNAEDLQAVLGQDVEDLTPSGYLPYQKPVVQVVVDITKGQGAKTVAGLIEDFLTAHPNVRRLGVIGHQKQVRVALGDETTPGLLRPELRRRVLKYTYFGRGDDRASNNWHGAGDCDHLLVIGTPRRRGSDIRAWLAHHGLMDAANLPGGDWGPRHWEGVTVDGRSIRLEGKGHRHPDWHRASTAIVRGGLLQAIGRARAILSNGIPVTVYTDEPTGLPVDDRPGIVTAVVRETVQVIRDHLAGRPLVCAIPPTSNLVDAVAQTEGRLRTGQAVHLLRETLGIGTRAAQIRLADAVKAGRLGRPQRGWFSVPLDVPLEPVTAVISQGVPAAPPTVVRSQTGPAVVVTATGPVESVSPVVVAVTAPPETTTSVCTMTASNAVALLPAVDLPDDEPSGVSDVFGVDTTALAVRSDGFVSSVLERVPGSVRIIPQADDPFSRGWGRPHQKAVGGRCRCGSEAWKDVLIHGGQSVRRDCARCDKYGGHVVWYGKPVAWPPKQLTPKVNEPDATPGMTFLTPQSVAMLTQGGVVP